MAEKQRKSRASTASAAQIAANRRNGFKPGQSGNPKGRPVDPDRKVALELLKANAPAVVQRALDLVLCDNPSERIMVALINKICPETLKLENDNPLIFVLRKQKSA